jgi:hypothetical protein
VPLKYTMPYSDGGNRPEYPDNVRIPRDDIWPIKPAVKAIKFQRKDRPSTAGEGLANLRNVGKRCEDRSADAQPLHEKTQLGYLSQATTEVISKDQISLNFEYYAFAPPAPIAGQGSQAAAKEQHAASQRRGRPAWRSAIS